MIDRPARDWMAMLIEGALTGPFDPNARYAIDPGPTRKSKDPIIQDAMDALEDFLNAPLQLNGAGAAPVILNIDDERRRMRNLLTFLRSDLTAKDNPGWPNVGCGVLAVLVISAILAAFVIGPPWSTRMNTILLGFVIFGVCSMQVLWLLTLGGFIWDRWIRPPKLKTDETDFWPFDSFAALQAERQRQQNLTP